MLTYEDCLGLGHITEEEVRAIAEHEHLPDLIALELGEYLLRGDDGVPRIRRIIVDDIEAAERSGHLEQRDRLKLVLAHFIATHPARTGSTTTTG